jgi:hypothetical protein
VLTAAILFAVYVALRLLAPHIRVGPTGAATLVATVVFLLLSLAIVVTASRPTMSWQTELAALALGVCLWFFGGTERTGLLSDCALVFSAIPLGRLVSRGIRYPNLLVPIGAVAAIVDVWGVNLHGPVSQVMEKAPETAQRFVTHVPAFGPPHLGAPQFVAIIGLGDFVFLALFFACVHRFGMNFGGAAICSAAFALLGLTIALLALPMPGLPFIALGVLLPNARHFHFERSEKFALLYGGLFLVACLGLATAWMHHALPKAPHAPPRAGQQLPTTEAP